LSTSSPSLHGFHKVEVLADRMSLSASLGLALKKRSAFASKNKTSCIASGYRFPLA
jgi:hypothetical protein